MNLNTDILLGITGGIAAYKSADLCRRFVKSGATVQVIMSEAACEFITPLTMETLSGRPVHVKMFTDRKERVPHIKLADKADLFVIAPATADYLARSAVGRASDLISAVTLAFDGPILAAPAMNTNMWQNPATKRNIETLRREHGWHFVSPESGDLACGWTGPGRMAEPEQIVAAAYQLFRTDLEGRNILVTAGPTVEDIDPVRFISNRSSGKMGYAIAGAAARRGAKTTLISGPTALQCPPGVKRVDIRSAETLESEIREIADTQDAIIMAAAVADYRPKGIASHKLKKEEKESQRTIDLVKNPDILQGLGTRFKDADTPILVGFALETKNLEQAAKTKLQKKGVHMIVGNLASDSIGTDDNKALIVTDSGETESTGPVTKEALANRILDRILPRLKKM